MKNPNIDILNLALDGCNAIKDGLYAFDEVSMVEFAKKIMAQCAIACDEPRYGTLGTPEELIAQHFGVWTT